MPPRSRRLRSAIQLERCPRAVRSQRPALESMHPPSLRSRARLRLEVHQRPAQEALCLPHSGTTGRAHPRVPPLPHPRLPGEPVPSTTRRRRTLRVPHQSHRQHAARCQPDACHSNHRRLPARQQRRHVHPRSKCPRWSQPASQRSHLPRRSHSAGRSRSSRPRPRRSHLDQRSRPAVPRQHSPPRWPRAHSHHRQLPARRKLHPSPSHRRWRWRHWLLPRQRQLRLLPLTRQRHSVRREWDRPPVPRPEHLLHPRPPAQWEWRRLHEPRKPRPPQRAQRRSPVPRKSQLPQR